MLQSLGPNAHIISVNDVYGGTFRYMRRVAQENQGLETTFLDLENADDNTIISAIRGNTKVGVPFGFRLSFTHINVAHLDRDTDKSYAARHRHCPHCILGPFTPGQSPRSGRQHFPVAVLLLPAPPRRRHCRA